MHNDATLWSAIYELYKLLVEKENSEHSYQDFFERNPIVFKSLGFSAAISFEKKSIYKLPFDSERNFRPEPDFIGIDSNSGLLSIIELKTPFVGCITTSRTDGNRNKFKATAESYISQTNEYLESISAREEARQIIFKAFGLKKISSYNGLLIYGLSQDNNHVEVLKLTSNRTPPIEIIFYDELLEKLAEVYAFSRRDIEERPGWCFCFHICFPETQISEKAYLASFGKGENNRLSVTIENGYLVFECIDMESNIHKLTAAIEPNLHSYIRFEFSNDANGIYMSLNVNNYEQDLRLGTKLLKFNPDTSSCVIGADSDGLNGAEFFLMTNYFVNKTLKMSDKLGSFHNFEREISGKEIPGLYYRPQSYMVRVPGAFIQKHERFKPSYEKWEEDFWENRKKTERN